MIDLSGPVRTNGTEFDLRADTLLALLAIQFGEDPTAVTVQSRPKEDGEVIQDTAKVMMGAAR